MSELTSLSLTVKQSTEYLPEMMSNITARYAPTVPSKRLKTPLRPRWRTENSAGAKAILRP